MAGLEFSSDSWVVVHAEAVTGTIASPNARLFGPMREIHARGVDFKDASGGLRVGPREYRAAGDDVTAFGSISVDLGPVPHAADHGIGGQTEYAEAFRAKIAGDVSSIDINAKVAFIDSAEQVGLAAFVGVLLAALSLFRDRAADAIGRALWPLYSRLSTDAATNQPMRRMILTTISENPGITMREMQRAGNLAWGEVAYHVGVLRTARAIGSIGIGRRVHLVSADISLADSYRLIALREADTARTFSIIEHHGELTVHALIREASLSRSKARRHLRVLKKAGLIVQRGRHFTAVG